MERIFEWMQLWQLKGFRLFYLFWILLFLTWGAAFFSWRNLKPADLFLLLVFMILAFRAQRHIELFVVIAVPILARHLTLDLRKALSEKTHLWGIEMRPVGQFINLAVILLLLFAGIWVTVPRRSTFGLGVRTRYYPEKAADFIKEAGITGRMYNEYEWGGYLIWRFFPQRKVFMDGRTVVYGEEIYQDWMRISEGRENWQETLDKYGVNFLILNYQKNRAASFWKEKRWVPIYWDDYALVAIRDAPENRSLIEKYDARFTFPITFGKNLTLENVQTIIAKLKEKTLEDPECALTYILLGRIMHRQGKWEEAIREYQRAIKIEASTGGPYYVTGAAYYFVAAAYRRQGYLQAAIDNGYNAIKFDPTDCDTYYQLANVYKDLGEAEKEQEMLERAALCCFRRGLIQLDLGETEEAKQWLEQAAILAPENEAIRAKLLEMGASLPALPPSPPRAGTREDAEHPQGAD
jgi:tetratricopeptide (TPR) repeat protein